MSASKARRLLLVLVLAILGTALLFMRSGPTTETVARQQALQSFAPVGASNDNADAQPAAGTEQVSPIVVNLADIPANVYDPNNQYDRWQRGEIDLAEHEGIVSAAALEAMQAESRKLPPAAGISQAVTGPGLDAPNAGISFASLDYTQCCGGGGNVPPDPELAAGPNHLIAVVNVAFQIYNTSGTALTGPITFASFMSADPNCTGVFDPNVLYDESADRFILGIDANGTDYCLAVSQSGNPTGSWYLYSFSTVSGRRDFFDYPHAGVGRDAIYMGANIFRGNQFKEGRVWAFDKAAMYAGASASAVSVGLGVAEDTPQPLNLHGWAQGTWPSSGPHYFLTETNYNGRDYTVFSWNDPFGANNFSAVGTVDLQAATGVTAGMPLDVPQSGGSNVQANDFRPQDFEYRNGYGWTVQTIACNPGSGTVDCIRWAQINPATATVVDAGVYASNGQYRFFGDLAANHCNDMVVGYTKSSTSMFPAVWYTGRESGDPAGTLQAEAQLKAGEITYTAFDSVPRRWGDYTEMTIGPDGVTFWYLGEYSKNTGTSNGRWGTYIGSFNYPNCSGGPLPTPTPPAPTPTAPPPTPSPTPDPNSTMHVGDLDGSSTPANRGRWNATVTITVHDAGDSPLANATVSGDWSGGASGSDSCTTDGNGQCSVSKNNIKGNQSSVTFTVTSVTEGTHTYNANANHDPDGDSNGTAITVLQP
ncbi:MAG: Ig-like domain-containing protein [Ardenticatenales bacterium]|nr:Ig-like domain-containing protein [Ardenticatenales bacterium]